MEKVKLGIIGCGGISQIAHLPALKYVKNIELIAVCDVSEKVARGISKIYSVPSYYTASKELLKNKEIDGVLIATPETSHAEISIAAMESGKHVLVAFTVEECE